VALLYDQHPVLGGAEVELTHESGRAEFVGAQLLEPGHDPAASGDGDQLDFGSADPPAMRQDASKNFPANFSPIYKYLRQSKNTIFVFVKNGSFKNIEK
jgi:hypothetical protein